MRTVYVPKDNLHTFVIPAGVPDDLYNYYAVEVDDVFVMPPYGVYDVASGKFVTDPSLQVSAARASINDRINAWRDYQRENSYVEYNGHKYDCDAQARYNLLGVITAGVMPLGFWTTYDNEDVAADLTDVQNIYKEVVALGGRIHERQRVMKEEVAALSDEALLNYQVGW